MPQNRVNRREKILNTAKDIFWKHGFKRVTVEDICFKAEVSKMTFYRFFQNKIELAKEVFNSVVEESCLKFHNIIDDPTNPDEKLRKILLMKSEGTMDISKEFISDFYSDTELGLKEFVQKKTYESWQKILIDIELAQKRGIFRSDFKPELFLFISQKFTELFNDQNLLKLYNNSHELIMETVNLFMYGIASRT